jgi:hypothetical protein
MTMTIDKATLRQFHGTENWYSHGIARNILYTDGAKYVAETAEAYWMRSPFLKWSSVLPLRNSSSGS